MNWRQITLENHQYLFNIKKSDKNIKFLLHDTVTLYVQEFEADKLKEKAEQFNPDLEDLDGDELLSDVYNLFGSPECEMCIINNTEGNLHVRMTWDSEGLPLAWEFNFRNASAQEFHENITAKLVEIIEVLLSGQKDLFKIIRDKDIELGEYKTSNVKMSRPNLTTEWFEPDKYLQQLSASGVEQRSSLQSLSSPQLLQYLKLLNEGNETKKDDPDGGSVTKKRLQARTKVNKKDLQSSKQKVVVVEEYEPKINKRKVVSEDTQETKKKAMLKKRLQKL